MHGKWKKKFFCEVLFPSFYRPPSPPPPPPRPLPPPPPPPPPLGRYPRDKKFYVFTLTVAVLSNCFKLNYLNYCVLAYYASKHYNLIGPYIWPSAWLLLQKCSLHSVPCGFKARVNNMHLGGNCTTQDTCAYIVHKITEVKPTGRCGLHYRAPVK